MKKEHVDQQATNGEAMARAQRDGAKARVGIPLEIEEPRSGMTKCTVDGSVPGFEGMVVYTGWDAYHDDLRKRFVDQNPVIAQTRARQWIAEQRRAWMRVHNATAVRLQARQLINSSMGALGTLCDGNDDLLGPVCGYIGEALLQLGMAAAQIDDDGSLIQGEEDDNG
jgi:hypothetical protein